MIHVSTLALVLAHVNSIITLSSWQPSLLFTLGSALHLPPPASSSSSFSASQAHCRTCIILPASSPSSFYRPLCMHAPLPPLILPASHLPYHSLLQATPTATPSTLFPVFTLSVLPSLHSAAPSSSPPSRLLPALPSSSFPRLPPSSSSILHCSALSRCQPSPLCTSQTLFLVSAFAITDFFQLPSSISASGHYSCISLPLQLPQCYARPSHQLLTASPALSVLLILLLSSSFPAITVLGFSSSAAASFHF